MGERERELGMSIEGQRWRERDKQRQERPGKP